MGGSLGLALKKSRFGGTVSGYARREETRRLAQELGACDEVHGEPQDAVRDADLTVVCVPIRSIVPLVEACAPGLRGGAVVTDVGSTKGFVMQAACRALAGRAAAFVGSHPMAGSEQGGLESARDDLYRGAVVAVTPGTSAESAVQTVTGLWQSLGAVVCLMDAERHDRIVARTSHMPHVAAALVAATAGREGAAEPLGLLTGKGFADTTRVADGPARVWRDILETNRDAVVRELTALEMELRTFRDVLEKGDFQDAERILEQCRDRRRVILAARPEGPAEGSA